MESAETFGLDGDRLDELVQKQKAQTFAMRAALTECDDSDPFAVRTALQNIKIQRIYHQIIRIIRYTEEMDKIENKLYQVIDSALLDIEVNDPSQSFNALTLLLGIQERLQKTMIDSQKLLDPYLNIKELTYVEVPANAISSEDDGRLLDQGSRKKLRDGAQAILDAISQEEA